MCSACVYYAAPAAGRAPINSRSCRRAWCGAQIAGSWLHVRGWGRTEAKAAMSTVGVIDLMSVSHVMCARAGGHACDSHFDHRCWQKERSSGQSVLVRCGGALPWSAIGSTRSTRAVPRTGQVPVACMVGQSRTTSPACGGGDVARRSESSHGLCPAMVASSASSHTFRILKATVFLQEVSLDRTQSTYNYKACTSS